MPTSFIFLQGLEKSYDGGVRAHVLRHYHSRKEQTALPRRKKNSHKTATPSDDGLIHTCSNGHVSGPRKGIWEESITDPNLVYEEAGEGESPSERTRVARRGRLKEPSEALAVEVWCPKPRWTVYDTLPADISMRERFLLYECKRTISPSLGKLTDSC
jgi:hypothetical protein